MIVNIVKYFSMEQSITVLVLDTNIELAGKNHCFIDNVKYDIPYSHNIANNVLPVVGLFNKTGKVELALN